MNSLWIFLIVLNAGSLILMGFDKLSAKAKSERVPEMWFFLISLAGGFIGVVLGMLVFHHKTSKRSFQLKIGVAAILPVFFLLFMV
jgi:uncharacterized membrane protein YsdA (DUF1294 family)